MTPSHIVNTPASAYGFSLCVYNNIAQKHPYKHYNVTIKKKYIVPTDLHMNRWVGNTLLSVEFSLFPFLQNNFHHSLLCAREFPKKYSKNYQETIVQAAKNTLDFYFYLYLCVFLVFHTIYIQQTSYIYKYYI